MVSLHRTHNGHQQLLLPLSWQKCPNLSHFPKLCEARLRSNLAGAGPLVAPGPASCEQSAGGGR